MCVDPGFKAHNKTVLIRIYIYIVAIRMCVRVNVSYANPNCSHSRRVSAAVVTDRRIHVRTGFTQQSASIAATADTRNRHYYKRTFVQRVQRTICACTLFFQHYYIIRTYRTVAAASTTTLLSCRAPEDSADASGGGFLKFKKTNKQL